MEISASPRLCEDTETLPSINYTHTHTHGHYLPAALSRCTRRSDWHFYCVAWRWEQIWLKGAEMTPRHHATEVIDPHRAEGERWLAESDLGSFLQQHLTSSDQKEEFCEALSVILPKTRDNQLSLSAFMWFILISALNRNNSSQPIGCSLSASAWWAEPGWCSPADGMPRKCFSLSSEKSRPGPVCCLIKRRPETARTDFLHLDMISWINYQNLNNI